MSNPSIVKHDTEGKSACGGVGAATYYDCIIYGAAGRQSNGRNKMLDYFRDDEEMFFYDIWPFRGFGFTSYSGIRNALLAEWKFDDIVKKIYGGKLSLTNPADKAYIDSDEVKMMVKKVYNSNPHEFFQILERKARLYINVGHRRLWILQQYYWLISNQRAIKSVQMLLEKYSQFCNSLSSLLYLLKPLEKYEHDLGKKVELMSKSVFCEKMLASYSDELVEFCQDCLSDHNLGTTVDNLIPRFLALCQEMDVISQKSYTHCKLIKLCDQIERVWDRLRQRQTVKPHNRLRGRGTLGGSISDESPKKPAVNFTVGKSGRGSDPVYKLRKVWVGEAGENQENPAVGFNGPGEKSGRGCDPVYSCEKLKTVWVGESDVNQEKPAVGFDGEKYGHGDDPVYNCGKLKQVYECESDDKPAVNLTREKSGRDDGPGAVYADVYKYGKLRRVQDQEKVAVGGKTGPGDGPVYKYGKWREVHAGESHVNRGKATNFTGEKFDHGNDTLCELGKMKKIDPHNRLRCYGTSGRSIWTAYMYTLLFTLIPAVTPLSLSNNLNGSTVVCPGQQVRFECLTNSPELIWSSLEYIGPTGVRIEFSGTLDTIGTTKRAGNAEATLLGLDGINVTSSELVILVSQDYPTASVTCDDGFQSVTGQFKVPGAPGIPQSIQASISSPQSGDCVALLQWDLPIDLTSSSFVSHYVVDFVAGMLTIPSQATVAALTIQNCDLNAAIGISAVDICGRQGARADVILIDVLQDTGSVTEWPSQTTAPSQMDTSTYILYFNWLMSILVMAVLIIAMIFVTSGIVIWYYQKKLGKVEAAIQLDEYTTSVEKGLLYKEK